MKLSYTYLCEYKTDFVKVFPKNKGLYLPLLKVGLRNKDSKTVVRALLDSGADICLFSKDIADVLGIDIKKGDPVEIIGVSNNKAIYYFHEVDLLFHHYEFKIKAGFSTGLVGGVGCVLGHHGFFDRFIVKFDYPNHEIEVNDADDEIGSILSKNR